eukprot:15468946-Alexandrium_andersonii.AAC.1
MEGGEMGRGCTGNARIRARGAFRPRPPRRGARRQFPAAEAARRPREPRARRCPAGAGRRASWRAASCEPARPLLQTQIPRPRCAASSRDPCAALSEGGESRGTGAGRARRGQRCGGGAATAAALRSDGAPRLDFVRELVRQSFILSKPEHFTCKAHCDSGMMTWTGVLCDALTRGTHAAALLPIRKTHLDSRQKRVRCSARARAGAQAPTPSERLLRDCLACVPWTLWACRIKSTPAPARAQGFGTDACPERPRTCHLK